MPKEAGRKPVTGGTEDMKPGTVEVEAKPVESAGDSDLPPEPVLDKGADWIGPKLVQKV